MAFQDEVDAACADVPGADFILCLSDDQPCYRKNFYPPYKGGRKTRPELYHPLRAWIIEQGWKFYLRPTLEADDILGILATHPTMVPGEKIISSIDKDLLTIPGLHVVKGDVVRISVEEAETKFLTQVLTGDRVDNYPGCPGIGPVKAARILDPMVSGEVNPSQPYVQWAWARIVEAYRSKGLNEQDALIQARCARILRNGEYNFKKREPILWTPYAPSAARLSTATVSTTAPAAAV